MATGRVAAPGLPHLDAKLHLPRPRRSLVARARLDRHLAPGALPAVALVSAPAGFGKTTLLAGWLAGSGQGDPRSAWLSLDPTDNDPAVFWSYVIAALRTVEPGIGAGALAALEASPPSLDAVAISLLNDLAALDGDLLLALDDYHVIEATEIHESMRFLVVHLPRQVHLVVATRADPPWPLAALRARGDLVEVRAADLRFTAQEAAAYLNDVMGLSLAAAEVGALEARTEGWIAALQLAALSLQGRDDPAAFIAGFAGEDRFVVDYLADEVLDRQPDDVRRFLLDTSILTRLSAPLCRAVTGRPDARSTLAALERANLFLLPLDDQRRWFRYHHLFADVLRARLADEAADHVADLHRRASDWFDAAGDPDDAIHHAMAAGDHARAARLIEISIPRWRQARQDATLRARVDALPREVFTDRPVLMLGLIGARMVAADTDGVDALLDQVEAWLDPARDPGGMIVHDQAELRRLPAQAAMYRAALALRREDLDGAIVAGQRAAELSAADDHLGHGAAAAIIGLAHWAGGELVPAERSYRTAIAAFERAGYLADILGCSLGLADILVAQGRLGAAADALHAGLALAEAHGPLRGEADLHIGLAEIHLERDELDHAAERLQASLDRGEHLALGQHAYRWRVVDARLAATRGDHAGALDRLAEAAQRYETDYSPRVRPVRATAARVRLVAGDVDGARRWADEAGLRPEDGPAYVREYEHLTFARVLLATGRAGEAIPFLQRLLTAAEAGGREGSAIEALVLLALAHRAASATAAATTCLAEARARAATEGHLALLREADATSAPASTRPGLVEELSPRERDVLRLLRTDLTGPEIAAQLVVSLNTVRTHTKHIFTKLGVSNRRAAVRRADELGL